MHTLVNMNILVQERKGGVGEPGVKEQMRMGLATMGQEA